MAQHEMVPVPGIPDPGKETIVVAVRPSEFTQATMDMLPESVRDDTRTAFLYCISKFEGLSPIPDAELTPDQKAKPDLVFFRVGSAGLGQISRLTRNNVWGTLVDL